MAERKRNRNALFLLDHKLYASDYDSEPSLVKTIVKTGLYRLHFSVSTQLAQGFRATFLDALSYLAAWNWLKVL